MIFTEDKEKYVNDATYQMKADIELKALPKCFDQCVANVEDGLNANEKNCLRSCYLKRVGIFDETGMYIQ